VKKATVMKTKTTCTGNKKRNKETTIKLCGSYYLTSSAHTVAKNNQ